ncbi:hypothetical protein [Candidatus Electronema sp. PJ]|uniref:hypothetical protein n=1 Tax=Candidatus Electronema sp. PJ TaxID=3401572 RepID=UPI003AA93420
MKLSLSITEEEICFDYISSNLKDAYKNNNAITPMREIPNLWIDFVSYILNQPEKDKKWFIDKGIWQAIDNLCWDDEGYDDWTLIKHTAALEGLCDKPAMLKKQECSKIREAAIESVKLRCSELSIKTEHIEQIVKNITDSNRSLNGYPVKWYIEKTLKDCNLEKFSENYLEKINDAIGMRNKVVHTGWAKEWKTDLFEHIQTIRSTIFLIVLARLEYPGKFYLSDHKHKKTTSLQEWQS